MNPIFSAARFTPGGLTRLPAVPFPPLLRRPQIGRAALPPLPPPSPVPSGRQTSRTDILVRPLLPQTSPLAGSTKVVASSWTACHEVRSPTRVFFLRRKSLCHRTRARYRRLARHLGWSARRSRCRRDRFKHFFNSA